MGTAARWFPARRDLPAPGAGRGSGWVGVSGYGRLCCPSARLPSWRTMNIHRAPSSPGRFLFTVFHPSSPTFPPHLSQEAAHPQHPSAFSPPSLPTNTRVLAPPPDSRHIPLPRPTAALRGGPPAPAPLSLPGACAGRGRGARPVGDRARDGTKPPPIAPRPSSTDLEGPPGSSPRSGPARGCGEMAELPRVPQPAPYPRYASRAALPAISKDPFSPPSTRKITLRHRRKMGKVSLSEPRERRRPFGGVFRAAVPPRVAMRPRQGEPPVCPQPPSIPRCRERGVGGGRGGSSPQEDFLSATSWNLFCSNGCISLSALLLILPPPHWVPLPQIGSRVSVCGGHSAACCNGVILSANVSSVSDERSDVLIKRGDDKRMVQVGSS